MLIILPVLHTPCSWGTGWLRGKWHNLLCLWSKGKYAWSSECSWLLHTHQLPFTGEKGAGSPLRAFAINNYKYIPVTELIFPSGASGSICPLVHLTDTSLKHRAELWGRVLPLYIGTTAAQLFLHYLLPSEDSSASAHSSAGSSPKWQASPSAILHGLFTVTFCNNICSSIFSNASTSDNPFLHNFAN